MIRLKGKWVTGFHRALATPEWMAELERFTTERVGSVGGIKSTDGQGTVAGEFQEDRYMGPNSAVKYHFRLRVDVVRPGDLSGFDQYFASVAWDPDTSRFAVREEHVTTRERDRALDLENRLNERMGTVEGQREVVDLLRATDCPVCGRRLRLEYYPEGSVWWCRCPSGEDHFDFQGWWKDWKDSPMSWKDAVADRTCPKCASSKAVVGILYGLIRDTSGIDDKVWALGGCVVGRERWLCKACGASF